MMHEPEIIDLTPLKGILAEYGETRGAVIPILQRVQDVYGYLPKEAMRAVSQQTGIPLSRLMGVATFYAQFRLERRGKHLIRICDGTACHVQGAAKLVNEMTKELGVPAGGTSPDYEYTMEIVYCLGSCGLAPVAVIDDRVFGRLTTENLIETLHTIE
jgi:NADH:ubiquinone oxidoreductase subunit E